MKILANENFPRLAVDALREIGHDVFWVRRDAPGISDSDVLKLAIAEERTLITFDKDFGELARLTPLPPSVGVILFRIRMDDVISACQKIVATIESRSDWMGHFSVIDDRKIRIRHL